MPGTQQFSGSARITLAVKRHPLPAVNTTTNIVVLNYYRYYNSAFQVHYHNNNRRHGAVKFIGALGLSLELLILVPDKPSIDNRWSPATTSPGHSAASRKPEEHECCPVHRNRKRTITPHTSSGGRVLVDHSLWCKRSLARRLIANNIHAT